MAITRLWFFTPSPPTTPTTPSFLALWQSTLDLRARYNPPAPVAPSPTPSLSHSAAPRTSAATCSKQKNHFLFRCDASSVLVLISTYPSLALCRQADAAYAASPLRADMRRHVRHVALRQLDVEDAAVVPALLVAGDDGGGGDGGGGGGGVAVTISTRDPLRTEEGNGCVLPPDEEISGADGFEVPPPPPPSEDGSGDDLFAAQRGEAKKWIRISKRVRDGDGGGDGDEVYRLTEILSR